MITKVCVVVVCVCVCVCVCATDLNRMPQLYFKYTCVCFYLSAR